MSNEEYVAMEKSSYRLFQRNYTADNHYKKLKKIYQKALLKRERNKMKRIVLFDTAQGTTNEGDYIIKECIDQEMDFLFKSQYIVRYSTHQPISKFYQMFRKNLISHVCSTSDYKFLCGTNLFMNSLLRLSPNWNINFTSCKYYEGSIAIGCGMDMNAKYMDPYTKSIYKKILSHDYIHSVRDEHTKLF